MKIELVVFDLAGTTLRDDDAVGRSFREALATAGITAPPDRIAAVMGLPKPAAIETLLSEAGRTSEPVQAIHADFVRRMRRYYAEDPGVRPMPQAEAVFQQLRQAGVRVALNTGFSRDIVQVILDRLRWHAMVDATISSDEVPRGRPHPDMIFALMKQLGVPAAQAVAKVGDTPADLGEGHAAGCGLNLGITHGTHTRAQLNANPHTHLVDSLPEAAALVLSHR